MTSSEKKLILAGIDGSDLSNAVVDYAIWASRNSQCPLKFLHTIEHSHHSEHPHHEGTITPNMKEHLLDELSDEEHIESKKRIAEGKTLLTNARLKAEQDRLTNVDAKQRHGTLSEALSDLEPEMAMVILGSKGEDHTGDKKGLGAQLEEAIRSIHTPVFIVKGEFSAPKTMMFAYNGSPTSKKALDMITQATISKLLDIHIVSVESKLDAAQRLVDEAKEICSKASMTVKTQALTGKRLEELTAYQQQQNIDITAMGAFSHGQLHGFFFGSFTTRMLLESSTNFLLLQ